MRLLSFLKATLEFLGGSLDQRPFPSPRWLPGWLGYGVWWAVLSVVIMIFCGQVSRFIYIDF